MKLAWWKIVSIVLLLISFVGGFLVKVPYVGNLYETIRNSFFHVPMWFGQMLLLLISMIYSIRYLRTNNLKYDVYAGEMAKVGIIFGVLGLVTGAIWANFTWGEYWSNDPKQMAAAIAVMIYFAYVVLRNSMEDLDKRAKISAVYNIFAYFIYIPLIYILPRMVESLHPGGLEGAEGGGNPGLGGDDMDAAMQLIFWPAVVGWILVGVWISSIKARYFIYKHKNIFNA